MIPAPLTIRDYCCAVCWSHLIETATGISCAKYGDKHEGYVTKAYAERRKAESQVEAVEVKQLLRQLDILPSTKKTNEQLLDELGF